MNRRIAIGGGAVAITIAALLLLPETREADLSTERSLAHSVYRVALEDGGKMYVTTLRDGGATRLDRSPCARRPTGVRADTCLRLLADGGTVDFGDENTMQPGEWVGAGCVRTACVVLAGEAPEVGP